ncbi:19774_t:CDS:2, partial [Entrophospora sp. SA101]
GQQDIPRKFISMGKNKEEAKELLAWIQDTIASGKIAVYGAIVHGAKNPAHLMTIAGQCLHHTPTNNVSPVQNYIVVNYRKRGQLPEHARPYKIYDEN